MDSQDLVQLIKKAALEAVDASQPANVLFGKVTSASPLKIFVDQKMTLTKEQLVLSRNVTDFTINVGVNNWYSEDHTHNHTISDTYTGGGSSSNETHKHQIKGTKSLTLYNALKIGEKVILIQIAGGQKFIVIDRIG